MRLLVPFYRQTQGASCVPAALRMVSAHWGHKLTEDELCDVCGTFRGGTSIDGCVQGATKYGFHVDLWCMITAMDWLRRQLPYEHVPSLRSLLARARTILNRGEAWTALKEAVETGKPVIAFTFTEIEEIPGHVVVVVEVTDDGVFFNDPAEPEESQPLSLSKQEFLTAWGDFNFLALVIP